MSKGRTYNSGEQLLTTVISNEPALPVSVLRDKHLSNHWERRRRPTSLSDHDPPPHSCSLLDIEYISACLSSSLTP